MTGRDHPKRFGRYVVEAVLGKGAMGVVYLAKDPAIDRKVAVKVLHSQHGRDDAEREAMRQRFETEIRSAGTLSHPYIVTVYDVGQEDDHDYLAMEFVDGESLEERIASGVDFSFEQVAEVAENVGAALDYAHARRIIHRDIKPGNILLTPGGEPKVTDFGVAKLSNLDMTTTGTIVGTPKYMAPEQIMGKGVGPSTDQWALAVVVFEMLTGGLPFEGDNPTTMMYNVVHNKPPTPRSLNTDLPKAIDDVLLRALNKNPEKRFRSCTAFANALRDGLRAAIDDLSDQETKAHDLSEFSTAVFDRPNLVDLELDGPAEATSEPAVAASQSGGTKKKAGGTGKSKSGVGAWVAILAVVTALAAVGWAYMRGSGPADWEGALEVTSAPPGAEIWVDGNDSGQVTPATVTINGPDGSPVTIELRQNGNVLATTQVTRGAAAPPSWQAALGPQPRRIQLISNPVGASVTFDGEPIGTAAVEVELEPEGTYEVKMDLDGYQSITRTISLDSLTEDQLAAGRLDFQLEETKPVGTLLVNADYAVSIEAAGSRQQGPRMDLPAGTHNVVFSAPAVFYRESRSVEVRSGETTEVTLPQAVTITVAATPSNCQVTIDDREVGFVPVQKRLTVGPHKFGFSWQGVEETVEVTEEIGPDSTRVFQVAPGS